jgi:hypothetical protein
MIGLIFAAGLAATTNWPAGAEWMGELVAAPWETLSIDPDLSRVYFTMKPLGTQPAGLRSLWVRVETRDPLPHDMRSFRMLQEFDCAHATVRQSSFQNYSDRNLTGQSVSEPGVLGPDPIPPKTTAELIYRRACGLEAPSK